MTEEKHSDNEQEKRQYEYAKGRVQEIKGFYIHLVMFVLVNAGLAIFNWIVTPGNWWFYWALIGWGIGLFSHFLGVFVTGGLFGKAWEERKIKEILEKEKKKE